MDAQRIKPSKLLLRFPRALEREYQVFHVQRNLGFARAAFAFGLFLYIGFSFLDYLLTPAFYLQLWLVRLGIGTPVLVAVLLFMFTRRFPSLMQPVLTIACMFIAISLDFLNVIAFSDTGDYRFFSVIIVNMYLHTFSRVQWAWAVPAGFANVLFYDLSLMFVDGVETPLLITANYLMVSALLAGMVACYAIELMSRREFLNVRDLAGANAELREFSVTDPLTGLANRRLALARMHEEYHRQARTGKPYCVAIVDADHFKQVNDEYGHACGDEILKTIAAVMHADVRANDTVSRWGGEEFLLVFPSTTLAAARIAAEKFRRRVQNATLLFDGQRVCVTVTIGIAEAGLHEDPEATVRRADQALYEGKQAGRNRTITAAPVAVSNMSTDALGSKGHKVN